MPYRANWPGCGAALYKGINDQPMEMNYR